MALQANGISCKRRFRQMAFRANGFRSKGIRAFVRTPNETMSFLRPKREEWNPIEKGILM